MVIILMPLSIVILSLVAIAIKLTRRDNEGIGVKDYMYLLIPNLILLVLACLVFFI